MRRRGALIRSVFDRSSCSSGMHATGIVMKSSAWRPGVGKPKQECQFDSLHFNYHLRVMSCHIVHLHIGEAALPLRKASRSCNECIAWRDLTLSNLLPRIFHFVLTKSDANTYMSQTKRSRCVGDLSCCLADSQEWAAHRGTRPRHIDPSSTVSTVPPLTTAASRARLCLPLVSPNGLALMLIEVSRMVR